MPVFDLNKPVLQRMKILLSCACLAVLIALAPCQKACARVFVLNTFDVYPYSTPKGTGTLDLIIKEAFRRIGQQVKIVWLPSKRAVINADQGIDDGDFVRVKGLEKVYHHLVMVPEKLCRFEFSAFVKDPSIRISGRESLKAYNVGIPRGSQILENTVTKVRSLTKVNDQNALFELLINGRIDVAVYDRRQGYGLMKACGITGIRAAGPVLLRSDMYIYLNRRYAGYVPRLAAAIRQMKQDGTFRRIMEAGPL